MSLLLDLLIVICWLTCCQEVRVVLYFFLCFVLDFRLFIFGSGIRAYSQEIWTFFTFSESCRLLLDWSHRSHSLQACKWPKSQCIVKNHDKIIAWLSLELLSQDIYFSPPWFPSHQATCWYELKYWAQTSCSSPW